MIPACLRTAVEATMALELSALVCIVSFIGQAQSPSRYVAELSEERLEIIDMT